MRINEIFLSLQGESSSAGLPTTFVRTTGCNLRCAWCDTTYAYSEGSEMTPEEVFEHVAANDVRRVCLTGGEPLLQPEAELKRLLELLAGQEVSIETNGAQPLGNYSLGPGHRWVMDVKCPSSNMAGRLIRDNLALLRPHDEVKFVIAGKGDYGWARTFIKEHGLVDRCRVILSPVHGFKPDSLAGWILEDRLDVRVQVQLHKVIWDPEARGA